MPKVLPADLGICRVIIRGAQCLPSAVRAARRLRRPRCPPSALPAVRSARAARRPRCPPPALPALPAMHSVRRPCCPPSALPAPSAVCGARGAQCPSYPRCLIFAVYDLRRLPQSTLSRSRRLPNAFTLPSAAKLTARYSGSLNSYSIKSPSEPYSPQSASVMSSVHRTSIL